MYRTALGYDLHRIMPSSIEQSIMCGGVAIPCMYQIDGAHSDGDVVLHALTDALFSVIGKDIGIEFPNNLPENKNRPSIQFLQHAIEAIENKYQILNVDIIVICDTPKIAPNASKIRTLLSQTLQISFDDISIRGKTTENTRPLTIESYVNVLFKKIN